MDQDLETRRTHLPPEVAGRRLDQALAELFPEFSRSRLTAWIKSGDVLVDGARRSSCAPNSHGKSSWRRKRSRWTSATKTPTSSSSTSPPD
jgi:23S rRNA pseudouridine1911/1915/1917 synthase